MTERYRQRQEAVMDGFRPKPVVPHAIAKPGETPEETRAREARGWLYLRNLMRRTRADEDGTWYRDEPDGDPGAA